MPEDIKAKLSLFCDVEQRAVIPMETADTIYRVPLILEESGLGDYVVERLQVPANGRDLDEWRRLVSRLTNPAGRVTVAVVGKYVELHDAYLSVKESLSHAGIFHDVGVDIRRVHSESLHGMEDVEAAVTGAQGIVVPGGFGERGIEGKVLAARYAREREVPYLGLCLGMQVMVVEFARHVFGTEDVNSTEFDPVASIPVISMLSEQRGVERTRAGRCG